MSAAKTASGSASLLAVGSITLSIILGFAVSPSLGVTVGILGVAGAIPVYVRLMKKAKGLCLIQCTCVREAVAFVDWDGTRQVFDIASTEYAAAFMGFNERKLVNISPQAAHVMEAVTHHKQEGGKQAARRYES